LITIVMPVLTGVIVGAYADRKNPMRGAVAGINIGLGIVRLIESAT